MKSWHVAVAAVVATTAAVETARAITDTVFQYSTPKAAYFGLSPTAFAPADNTTATVTYTTRPAGITHGASGCFGAAVNLPQGATITQFIAWYSSIGSQVDEFTLYRQRVTDGQVENIVFINATAQSTNGLRKQVGTNVAASPLTVVNNAAYVYGAYVCLGNSNTSFYAARVRYTYTNAGD